MNQHFNYKVIAPACWSIKGKSVVFEKNPARGHIKVFGSIELFTGRLIYSTEKDKLSSKRFVKFLKHIIRRYNSKQNIDIILDNATYSGSVKLGTKKRGKEI